MRISGVLGCAAVGKVRLPLFVVVFCCDNTTEPRVCALGAIALDRLRAVRRGALGLPKPKRSWFFARGCVCRLVSAGEKLSRYTRIFQMLLPINWACQAQLLAATFRIPTKDTKIQNCNVERAIQRLNCCNCCKDRNVKWLDKDRVAFFYLTSAMWRPMRD